MNNAVTADLDEGAVAVAGNGAEVSVCYCASRSENGFAWGGAFECGSPCDDGSVSGRFVEITARAPFNPVLGAYALFTEQTLINSAVVRLP